jgi:hypothetical protein
MLTFIQKCGATSETAEDLRDFIMNAKKPSNLRFEDFKQRLEELDDYLPYLPGPLNQCLGDNQLFVTLKKCVPAWQKKYTDSNARKNIDVNDLADYYGDLENQEKKECNQDNRHRDRNSSQGQNRSQQRNRSQRSNENHYIKRNNGYSDRRQGGSDSRNSRGRSSNDNHHGQGNQDKNKNSNAYRQDGCRQDNQNQGNSNSQCRYNTCYQEQRRENETHQIDTDNESNDGQETYISNQSNDDASNNEFYFADEKFHDTNKRPMTRKKMMNLLKLQMKV